MTPQAFSYPTVSNNGKIYIPPYGLNEVIDYMLKFDPADNSFKKIQLQVNLWTPSVRPRPRTRDHGY